MIIRMSAGTDILERIIEPQHGGFSEEHARYVLSLDFTADEQARYAELSSRVQQSALAPDELAELDRFLSVNALLMLLQSKARVSLKQHNSAA